MCQETFLRAFRALPGFRGQAKFSSWLYRIALNLCRDWMRRERRDAGRAAARGRRPDGAGGGRRAVRVDRGSRRAQGSDAAGRTAMALLPEEQRTAIVLKEYHGLTFQEIADLVGLSVEHGEDAAVSGADGAAARAGEEQQGHAVTDKAMTELFCSYGDDRDEAIVAFLYDDPDASRRARRFEAHLPTCARCQRRGRGAARRARAAGAVVAARADLRHRQLALESAIIRSRRPAIRAGGSASPGVGAGRRGAAVSRRLGRHRQPRRPLRPERPDASGPAGRSRRAVGAAGRRVGRRSARGASPSPTRRGAPISPRSSSS